MFKEQFYLVHNMSKFFIVKQSIEEIQRSGGRTKGIFFLGGGGGGGGGVVGGGFNCFELVHRFIVLV
jgi:hypothetical protein